MTAAALLSIFLLLHFTIGLVLPLRRNPRPCLFLLIENIGANLERRLNRETRPQSIRFIRGAIVALVMGAGGYMAGAFIPRIGALPYGQIAYLVLLLLCIDFMAPLKLLRQVARQLDRNDLPAAVETLQPCLKEPLEKADTHTVIRKALAFIAASLNMHLVAPAFWFLAGGPAGLSLYMTYAALHQAFGLQDERRRHFGRAIRIIDALLNVPPAALTAVLLSLSALFVSRSSPLRAAATVLEQSLKYRSAYLGLPLAALAGGLGVTLGGPIRYSPDYAEDQPWIGPEGSSAKLSSADLARASLLQYVSFICLAGGLCAFVVLENSLI